MRAYQIVSLLVICTALALVTGLKLGDRRGDAPSQSSARDEESSCACEVPEGWGEDPGADGEDVPEIPPRPGLPSVVAFIAGDAEGCSDVEQLLTELEPRLEDVAGVAVVDANAHRDQAEQWRLRMVPTVVILDSAGEEFARHEGPLSAEEVLTQLRAAGAEVE